MILLPQIEWGKVAPKIHLQEHCLTLPPQGGRIRSPDGFWRDREQSISLSAGSKSHCRAPQHEPWPAPTKNPAQCPDRAFNVLSENACLYANPVSSSTTHRLHFLEGRPCLHTGENRRKAEGQTGSLQ